MNVQTSPRPATEFAADALVVGVFSDSQNSTVIELDQAIGGMIKTAIDSGDFTGELNETLLLPNVPGIVAQRILAVGLGKQQDWCAVNAQRSAGTATKTLVAKKRDSIAYLLPAEHESNAVCGAIVANIGQDIHRAEKAIHTCPSLFFLGFDDVDVERGRILGESMNLTRHLVNQPANVIYPESFADHCSLMADQHGLEIEIWDEEKLEAERCGSLLGVSLGSDKPPRMVIMRYKGGGNSDPIALVGKGVTFDCGGLSIKTSDGMKTMKCDMAGAATVVGAMNAIAQLKPKLNVVGMVGLVENMINGEAYKLGDVLQSRNGKTIEILNTDAEGRLVLADVLDVAVTDEKASKVIDLATLTGACVVALGFDHAGVMTNQQSLCDKVLRAAATCGEGAWQLPMDSFFAEELKSGIADLKNIGNGRWGGAITAGKFLEEFVRETPWVHLDIAGPAYSTTEKSHIDAGATGRLVQTLTQFVLDQD